MMKSSQDFARDLIAFCAKLTAEQKAEMRLALYLWASERLTRKPADR